MKIVFLADDFPPLSLGGGGVITYNLAKEMTRQGHQVFAVSSVQKKNQAGKENIEGITVYRIYSKYPKPFLLKAYISLYNPLTVGKVRKILKEIKPEIVHAQHIHVHLSYHLLKLAKKMGAKVFLTAHDVMLVSYGKAFFKPEEKNFKISVWQQVKIARKGYNPFRNIIIRHYLKYLDKIFPVSQALKRVLAANGIKNMETIHNGIDVSQWSVSEKKINNFKERVGLLGKRIIFWGGGRLSGAKGAVQILKAMAVIKEKHQASDVVLVIAGNKGFYTDKMEKLAKELGIEDSVIFTGKLNSEQMKTAFFSCNISVTPSVCFDSFPNVNLEAMAAKKPVVATCFGGSPEIVKDGKTGYIVNPNDENILAEKIFDLLENSAKAKKFGLAGHQRVKNHFSLTQQAQKTLSYH